MDKKKRGETSKQKIVRDYFRSMLMLGVLKEAAVNFDADRATRRRGVRVGFEAYDDGDIGSDRRLKGRP
jgi:hypothetical protein